MSKLIFSIARFLRGILPGTILVVMLRRLQYIPYFGHRLIAAFDPNNIRKHVNYTASPNITRLAGQGWTLKLNMNDHIGFQSLIKNEPFEMTIFKIGQKLSLTEGDIILDIGANIGTASVPICKITGAELIAIEASKENAALLAENILANEIKAQIHMFALMGPQAPPYIKFYIQRGNTGTNSIYDGWNPSKMDHQNLEHVPTTTVDGLAMLSGFDIERIKLVKIDVEGAEQLVLSGASYFLKENSAPIVLEYRRDAAMKFRQDDLSGLVKILTEAQYQIYALSDESSDLLSFDPTQSYENIVALKSDSFANSLLLDLKDKCSHSMDCSKSVID